MSACDRFPCDFAYRRREHEVDEEGCVWHVVNVGSERIEMADGSLPYAWRVDCATIDDEPWSVKVTVCDPPAGLGTYEFRSAEESIRFSADVTQATVSVLTYNARDNARQGPHTGPGEERREA